MTLKWKPIRCKVSPWWRAVWAAGCSRLRWGDPRPETSSWRRWRTLWSCGRSPRAAGSSGSCPDAWTPAAGFSRRLEGQKHRDDVFCNGMWCNVTASTITQVKCTSASILWHVIHWRHYILEGKYCTFDFYLTFIDLF